MSRPPGRPPGTRDVARIVALYVDEGLTAYDIAEITGLSHVTVLSDLRAAGVEIRAARQRGPQSRLTISGRRLLTLFHARAIFEVVIQAAREAGPQYEHLLRSMLVEDK